VARSLCEILKSEFAQDLQNLTAGENSQFRHHTTASSSMVARIVGSLEKPSSEKVLAFEVQADGLANI
jgi:hypothetical protein